MSEFYCPICGEGLVDYGDGDYYCEDCDVVFQDYDLDEDDPLGLDYDEDEEEWD